MEVSQSKGRGSSENEWKGFEINCSKDLLIFVVFEFSEVLVEHASFFDAQPRARECCQDQFGNN